MSGLCIAGFAVGAAGLIGGCLWGWGASRTATRVAVKIVAAANKDRCALASLDRRVYDLEHHRCKE
ncbi:hypothetical protein [Candidatus Poriferisodalis sp.]|uniref:hypothetical protein n=1 Tax=Candidatus Poriferisodalis sp. TaxID=3101277 RepID=UPI003B0294AE